MGLSIKSTFLVLDTDEVHDNKKEVFIDGMIMDTERGLGFYNRSAVTNLELNPNVRAVVLPSGTTWWAYSIPKFAYVISKTDTIENGDWFIDEVFLDDDSPYQVAEYTGTDGDDIFRPCPELGMYKIIGTTDPTLIEKGVRQLTKTELKPLMRKYNKVPENRWEADF